MRPNLLSQALALTLLATFMGCTAPAEDPDAAEEGSAALAESSGTAGDYTRQEVYSLVRGRMKGASGSPADVLDAGRTTQALVNALGWHATHSPPEWGFSVINTGHHYDPAAHSGGFSIDFFANSPGDDARFMAAVNANPYFVEIGVSGDYAGRRGAITTAGKCAFVEDAPTHVHASVKPAFCRQ